MVFIYSVFPIFTLLLSALLLHTAVRRVDAVCTLTVVLGMGLIVWGQSSLHNLLGAALSLAANWLFALITVGSWPRCGFFCCLVKPFPAKACWAVW
ncbi:MAG: hypothetical protein ORN29_08240 [Rhodoferax sp.]|nr:hypothetical protein [Rhodoferax sp.]